MKKTLFSLLLALASTAMGTTLNDALLNTSAGTTDMTTVVNSATDNGSFTIVAKLDASIFPSLAVGQAPKAYRFVSVSGHQGTTERYIGLGTGYSSQKNVMTSSTLWGTCCDANNSAVPTGYCDLKPGVNFTATACENVESAVLAFSYNAATFDSITRLVITYNDGKDDMVINVTNNVFKWTVDGNAGSITSVETFSINTEAVKESWFYQGALDQETCTSLVTAALTYTPVIPPTEAPSVTAVGWADGKLLLTITGDTSTASLAVLVGDDMWKQMMQTVTANGGSVSGEGVAISLVDGAGNAIDLTNYTSVTFNGYVGEGEGKYAVIYVPEPATTTLGLLALAGLAARRRRK